MATYNLWNPLSIVLDQEGFYKWLQFENRGMGAGASVSTAAVAAEEKDKAVVPPEKALNSKQKEWLVQKIRGKYETGVAPEKVLSYAQSLPTPPRYVSVGESRMLSVSILHRHGSRGPGMSELKPWGDHSDNGVVSQWQPKEIENLTTTGHILVSSLGRFFSERYIMDAEDPANEREVPMDEPDEEYQELKLERDIVSKGNLGRSMWRCSRSNRVFESGTDFNQALCGTFNHPAQVAPIKDILPRNPTRYEDVEDENREDDHGVDHYFRPWNVFKKEMSAVKNSITSNLDWVNKANNNIAFLKDFFGRVGVDESVLACAPKMLWCCTYAVCLHECERFWPTFVVPSGDHYPIAEKEAPAEGEDGGGVEARVAAKQAEMKKRERRNLTRIVEEMEEEYQGSEKKQQLLRPLEEFPQDGDEGGQGGPASPSKVKQQEEEDAVREQELGLVMARMHALALWVWEQRFVKSPYATELGGRMAFDILQTTMNYPRSGLNLFSAHDYTILGVLSVLRLFPGGHIPNVVGFGGYVVFELWSDTPPKHASYYREKQHVAAMAAGASDETKDEEGRTGAGDVDIDVDGGDDGDGEYQAHSDVQARLEALAEKNSRKPPSESPEDRRVLRVLYNDAPFDHRDEQHVVEYMEAYADAANPVQRDMHRRKWPVMEDNERVLGEWDMPKVARVMGDLLEACKARDMKVCLKGSPHEDYRWLL